MIRLAWQNRAARQQTIAQNRRIEGDAPARHAQASRMVERQVLRADTLWSARQRDAIPVLALYQFPIARTWHHGHQHAGIIQRIARRVGVEFVGGFGREVEFRIPQIGHVGMLCYLGT